MLIVSSCPHTQIQALYGETTSHVRMPQAVFSWNISLIERKINSHVCRYKISSLSISSIERCLCVCVANHENPTTFSSLLHLSRFLLFYFLFFKKTEEDGDREVYWMSMKMSKIILSHGTCVRLLKREILNRIENKKG